MNTTTRREQIISSLASKRAREAFVASLIRIGLPAQIHELRDQRGWSQGELGRRAGKTQTVISRFESFGYEAFTLSTLKELAAAFDVGLKVRFVAFSELVDDASYPRVKDLDVPSFVDDARLEIHDASTFQFSAGTITEFGIGPDAVRTQYSGTTSEVPGSLMFQANGGESWPSEA